MRAEQFAPYRSAGGALHPGDHNLACLDAVEELHQKAIRLRGYVGDLYDQHRCCTAGDFDAAVERPYLRPHDLMPESEAVENVSPHLRVQAAGDAVQARGRITILVASQAWRW